MMYPSTHYTFVVVAHFDKRRHTEYNVYNIIHAYNMNKSALYRMTHIMTTHITHTQSYYTHVILLTQSYYTLIHTHIHTHTHRYTHTQKCMCMYVCVRQTYSQLRRAVSICRMDDLPLPVLPMMATLSPC